MQETSSESLDLILAGGRVLDPGIGVDEVADIGIAQGRIQRIGPNLDREAAGRTINVSGLVVTPGLIDLHTHVAGPLRKSGTEDLFLPPDVAGVHSGVTTVVDAGSVGAYTLGGFARFVANSARTRVISFLNAGTVGIFHAPEIRERAHIDVDAGVQAIASEKQLVRGVKVRMVGPALDSLGMDLPKLAKQMAGTAGVPLMVHIGDIVSQNPVARELAPRLLREVLTAGDIVTHTTSHQVGALLNGDGKLLQEAQEARERGVLFDAGVGMANFTFDSARAVLGQGFVPDTISSDLTVRGRHFPTHSLTECMNKFIALGLAAEDVILRTTRNPAMALGLSDQLGAIAVGREADLSVLELREGTWRYRDMFGGDMTASHTALTPKLAIRGGEPMPLDFGPHPWGWWPETA